MKRGNSLGEHIDITCILPSTEFNQKLARPLHNIFRIRQVSFESITGAAGCEPMAAVPHRGLPQRHQ